MTRADIERDLAWTQNQQAFAELEIERQRLKIADYQVHINALKGRLERMEFNAERAAARFADQNAEDYDAD